MLWQLYSERRSGRGGIVLAKDFSAVLADDAVTNAQAEASAFAHRLSGKERVKDLLDIVDPGAVVFEIDADVIAVARSPGRT